MDWYLMVWQKYAQFTGRSRRREYWMFALFNMIFCCVLYAAILVAFVADQKTIGIFLACLSGIYVLAALIPGLAVSVRRLHDINKSGLWLLLNFIPFGGLVLLILACIESDPGTNQYGPNPKLFPQAAMS
ncbi:MAG TPA: DUF805 domain-containing protein [Acidobacteriaceae bacterium]|nr:DUF805 domain-containing protein [Acidobacteriaceae bacterium]